MASEGTGAGVIDKPEPLDPDYEDINLVVCPLSVIGNWQDQLKEHAPSLRVHVYHGPGRDLRKKGIVVRVLGWFRVARLPFSSRDAGFEPRGLS